MVSNPLCVTCHRGVKQKKEAVRGEMKLAWEGIKKRRGEGRKRSEGIMRLKRGGSKDGEKGKVQTWREDVKGAAAAAHCSSLICHFMHVSCFLSHRERVASEYNGREKEWRRIKVANVDMKVKVKLSGDITILFFNNRRMIIIVRSSAMIHCDYPPATASRPKSKGG